MHAMSVAVRVHSSMLLFFAGVCIPQYYTIEHPHSCVITPMAANVYVADGKWGGGGGWCLSPFVYHKHDRPTNTHVGCPSLHRHNHWHKEISVHQQQSVAVNMQPCGGRPTKTMRCNCFGMRKLRSEQKSSGMMIDVSVFVAKLCFVLIQVQICEARTAHHGR